MKLRQLEALRAIAEAKSLHEAARRLFLTQPAISRSIRELEIELGLPLLTRSARGASLTPFAHQVLKRSQVVQREVGRILEDAAAARGELAGQLRIAVTPPASTRALADTLLELVAARPGVRPEVIEWRAENIADGLDDGTIDVGVFTQYREPRTTAFEWVRLYELDVVLSIPASWRGKRTMNVTEIHALPWIVLDAPEDDAGFVATFFGRYGLPLPKQTLRCSSMNLYLDLAMRMEAVAVWTSLARPYLAERERAGSVILLDVDEPLPRSGVYLAYSSEDLLTATAQDFIQRLSGKLMADERSRSPAGLIYDEFV
ncbi:LysR family transcriptional regulator [Paraburkholderia sp. Ac-20340]|uniref:LysR family transcriptional regulator n=1 Tax=Paraburkholderia sp. Ac-20340 TaxID=2703888 RepID=UPI00197F0DDC|nr:LysR family transcriptional regulator [Paraburkholderia sp. Ac-20340]MBN3852282.1 LysR family transcriptional regulator [Paraburkholderia sp. Ac-20340]